MIIYNIYFYIYFFSFSLFSTIETFSFSSGTERHNALQLLEQVINLFAQQTSNL